MKKTILLFAIIFSLFSCSKDDEPTPTPAKTYDIKGYYQGTYGAGTSTTGSFLALVLEENGKATFINNTKFNGTPSTEIYYGTYGLTGSQVNITTTNSATQTTIDLNGTFDKTTGKLSGALNSTSAFNGSYIANKNITGKESISGYWKGTYAINGGGITPYFMIIENDGTCVMTANNNDGFTNAGSSKTLCGNFSLGGGTVFTNTVTDNFGIGGSQYSNKADFDNTSGKLINGTYGNGLNYTNSNNWTWNMTKMYY